MKLIAWQLAAVSAQPQQQVHLSTAESTEEVAVIIDSYTDALTTAGPVLATSSVGGTSEGRQPPDGAS